MKRLTLYILIVILFTCGCTKSNLNSDETFSQSKNQEITNHEISLNKEEPQPQEKEQKEYGFDMTQKKVPIVIHIIMKQILFCL